MKALSLKNLHKTYGKVEALRGIDLEVEAKKAMEHAKKKEEKKTLEEEIL